MIFKTQTNRNCYFAADKKLLGVRFSELGFYMTTDEECIKSIKDSAAYKDGKIMTMQWYEAIPMLLKQTREIAEEYENFHLNDFGGSCTCVETKEAIDEILKLYNNDI